MIAESRKIRRGRLRAAHDELGREWRKVRRQQGAMMALGMLPQEGTILGRRPPMSALSLLVDGDAGRALGLSPGDVLELAREKELGWRGRDVRAVPVGPTIPLVDEAVG